MAQTGVVNWSQTAATNNTSDANNGVGWSEGQAPSTVNDSSRAMMSSVAKWRDDITGIIVTAGSGTAYTAATSQTFASNGNGFTIQFTPGSTNTGAVTLAVDGQTAQPLRFLTGVDLPSGVLISGSLYQATYRSATSEWLLHASPLAAPFIVPVGGIIDYIGATAPNANFVLPTGQAISRTTYSVLFGLIGTTFGVGDGSTTFNVPDLTGRVTAMKEAVATRLTTAGGGIDGATLGAASSTQSKTLLTGNLPAYTPSGSIAVTGHVGIQQTLFSIAAGAVAVMTPGGSSAFVIDSQGFTGAAQGGTSTPFAIVQPTIIVNKILRII